MGLVVLQARPLLYAYTPGPIRIRTINTHTPGQYPKNAQDFSDIEK